MGDGTDQQTYDFAAAIAQVDSEERKRRRGSLLGAVLVSPCFDPLPSHGKTDGIWSRPSTQARGADQQSHAGTTGKGADYHGPVGPRAARW